MSNQDTRALVLIKGVVDDCSLDVVESMRRIREFAGADAADWRDARIRNATERLRDVVRLLEGLQDTPAESCPDCNGHGTIFSPTEPLPDFCYLCGGTGKVAPATLKAAGGSPAESPDPIGELEAMGAFLTIRDDDIVWMILDADGGEGWIEQVWALPITTDTLRAAAARLLERVRGSKP